MLTGLGQQIIGDQLQDTLPLQEVISSHREARNKMLFHVQVQNLNKEAQLSDFVKHCGCDSFCKIWAIHLNNRFNYIVTTKLHAISLITQFNMIEQSMQKLIGSSSKKNQKKRLWSCPKFGQKINRPTSSLKQSQIEYSQSLQTSQA